MSIIIILSSVSLIFPGSKTRLSISQIFVEFELLVGITTLRIDPFVASIADLPTEYQHLKIDLD